MTGTPKTNPILYDKKSGTFSVKVLNYLSLNKKKVVLGPKDLELSKKKN